MTTMPPPPPLKLPFQPRHIVMFSGHVVDTPDRPKARLTPSMVMQARQRIEDVLSALDLGASDIALTQGAAGGDILFGEVCLARHVPLQLLLPLPEDEFIATSIVPSIDGEGWRRRYDALKENKTTTVCVMPQAPVDKFRQCNAWMLATATASGAREIHLVCLWDGADGDGCGGTADMVQEVARSNGDVIWIDTRTLHP